MTQALDRSEKKVLRSFRIPSVLDEFLRSFAKKLKLTDSDIVVRCLESVRESGEMSVDVHDIRVPGGYRLEVTEHPLPDTVEGTVSLIRAALNQGGVQEFILRLGQPVRISRLITDESDPIDLFQISDVAADIRNLDSLIEIESLPVPADTSTKMMREVLSRGMKPRAWACKSEKLFQTWLRADLENQEFDSWGGIPIYTSSDIPDEALVLLGSPDGVDRITFGVKTVMEGAL